MGVEALARELPALFCRVGKAMLLCKDYTETDGLDLAKIERKLRDNLHVEKELAPVLQKAVATAASAQTAASAAGSKSSITPNVTPSLRFDQTGVINDDVAIARSRGFCVGVRVKSVKDLRGIRKHAKGTIAAVGKEIGIRWDAGSRQDEADAQEASEEVVGMTLNSLCVLSSDELKAKPKRAAPAAEVDIPDGIAWVARHPTALAKMINQAVLATVAQAYASGTPDAELLRVISAEPAVIVAAKDIPKGKLTLLPCIFEMGEKISKKKASKASSMSVTVGAVTEYFRFGEPADRYSTIQAEATDDTLCYLYWMVMQSTSASGGASCCELQLTEVELTVPFPIFSTKVANLKGKRDVANSITIGLPMLVNDDDIAKGSQILAAGMDID